LRKEIYTFAKTAGDNSSCRSFLQGAEKGVEVMDAVMQAIKKLEALRDEAYFKSTHHRGAYASNRAGQYTAYHKAVELVKKAVRQETDIPGCVCCGEIIPESGQFCPKCRKEADRIG